MYFTLLYCRLSKCWRVGVVQGRTIFMTLLEIIRFRREILKNHEFYDILRVFRYFKVFVRVFLRTILNLKL